MPNVQPQFHKHTVVSVRFFNLQPQDWKSLLQTLASKHNVPARKRSFCQPGALACPTQGVKVCTPSKPLLHKVLVAKAKSRSKRNSITFLLQPGGDFKTPCGKN